MSLFGGYMGDLDEDPFFGGHMRRMNNMMNSMMNDFFAPPFGGMLGAPPTRGDMVPYEQGGRHHRARGGNFGPIAPLGGALMPMGFGFPNLRSVFEGIGTPENCHSFSSSTIMTMTSGPDGRPQVYQASTSTRQAPGGIKETKKTVADSRTGLKKMSIGHHIGERAHILEREHNLYQGTAEEHQEFINLEEEEADDFNREWDRKARAPGPAITYHGGSQGRHGSHQRGRNNPQLALPPSTTTASSARHGSRSRRTPTSTIHRNPQLVSTSKSSRYGRKY